MDVPEVSIADGPFRQEKTHFADDVADDVKDTPFLILRQGSGVHCRGRDHVDH